MSTAMALQGAKWRTWATTEATFAQFLNGNDTSGYASFFVYDPVPVQQLENLLASTRLTGENPSSAVEKAQLFIDSLGSKLKGVNSSNHSMDLDVWYLFPKRNIPYQTVTNNVTTNPIMFGNLTYDTTNSTNVAANNWFYQGLLQTSPGALPPMPTSYMTPYMSMNAAEMFDIKYKKHYHLGIGESINLGWKWRPKRLIKDKDFAPWDQGTLSRIATNWSKLKEMGPLILLRATGALVHDESLVTAQTTVRTTGTNVGVLDSFGKQVHGNFYLQWGYTYQAKWKVPRAYLVTDRTVWHQSLTTTAAGVPQVITNANQQLWNVVAPQDAPISL